MKACVLLSGGMDSVTLLYEAARRHEIVACLTFDYGSKHNACEIPFAGLHAARLGVPHHVVALDFMDRLFASDLLRSGGRIPDGHYAEETMKRTVVPFRNGILLAVAAGYAESHGAELLMIAAHSGDHAIYPDCREEFLDAMATAVREGTYARLEIDRPFVHLDKAGIARLGAGLGVDFRETWSCYKGRELHCGTCGTCVERREAFLLAGLEDPTAYATTPPLPEAPRAS